MKNTQDWLDGFNYGKQAGFDEALKYATESLNPIEKNLDNIEKTVENLNKSSLNIFKRLFKYFYPQHRKGQITTKH